MQHNIHDLGIAPPAARGFSLIEVMVALLVLSLGLLGLAALQTTGLKLNLQSYQRTQATMLSYEIVDRMRTNPQGVAAGSYALALTDADPSPSVDCATTSCTAAQLAAYDLRQWRDAIKGNNGNLMLPQANGAIVSNGSQHTITVTWDEQGVTMTQNLVVQL